MRVASILVVCAIGHAHAEVGIVQEGGLGKASASGFLAEDGSGMAVRAAFGYRRGAFGGEAFFQTAELGHDDSGFYTALTTGPMLTVRHVFAHAVMDAPFSRWFELYGRAGPTYTWTDGDSGNGPLDRASGWGFAAGGGVRFVYAMIGLSIDVTLVKTHVQADTIHDPADELRVHDKPGVDAHGSVFATTFGIGFFY